MGADILIVDDEQTIADLVEVYLKNEGFTVHKFYNGEDAIRSVESEQIDLAILDVMLPDIDGFSLCRKIREKHNFPIIMLTAKSVLSFSGLVLNQDTHECTLNEKPLSLTPTEFSILWVLSSNRGHVVSSEELFREVWGEKYYSNSNNTVMVHIRHLREKMCDSAEHPKYIKTVWGVGYKIEK